MAEERIIKIAVIGAESTGKTSLCEALAKHYNTVWVPEYAREYFNNSSIYNYSLDDLVLIAKKQIELEEQLEKKAKRFLFCDTTLITLKIWAELEFECTPTFIDEGLKKTSYDLFFLAGNDVKWEKDEQRLNKFSRDLILEMNIAELKKVNAKFAQVFGTEKERLEKCISIVKNNFLF